VDRNHSQIGPRAGSKRRHTRLCRGLQPHRRTGTTVDRIGLTLCCTPTSGRRVELFICGRLGSQDGETLSTWASIANMLGNDGAKWKLEHGGLIYFDRGCSPSGGQPLGQGLVVYVSKNASKTTMEAARALSEALAKTLPPPFDKMANIVDPEFSQRFMQPIKGKDTPWAMAANDPDLITVLIGAHPQQ
jgi:hypothetical protein